MTSLLMAVKSKMYIFAHRKARGMLIGEYASVFRGRSLDFDDLRSYVPGDDVRDIDWKATARVGSPLVKRYVATRRQQVLFVADTGRNMAATARGGETKKDLAVMIMGVIGSLALGHGDSVALVHGDARAQEALPAKGTEGHLERLLRIIDAVSLKSGSSDLVAALEYAAAHYKQRMLLVVIADELAVQERCAKVLRRLGAQHEILWVQIDDVQLAGAQALRGPGQDVAAMDTVLTLLAQDPGLVGDYEAATAARAQALADLLQSVGIVMTRIGHTEQVVGNVFALLERHRRAH
ncbi:DUF58 domain-containing protein [Arthrobacter sp. GMC3]|uniref:DUF58 domain-containing protein n=1 Tax=Arthrobacter sp. GMC3 TaxID=2058894 RepID=UPI0021584293|nr:DUF58 domain-containing protein [Arthrobacter sp. GMC3]